MKTFYAFLVGGVLCLSVLTGCKKEPPADVAATVNGRPITYADVDKLVQAQFGADALSRPNDDQLTALKLQVLVQMVNAEIMLQRAEKQSLMASDSEVEQRVNEFKAPYTQEEFQKWLSDRKLSLDDLKRQFRRDLSIQKLVNKEITSKISISDREVGEFYNNNRNLFNLAEPRLHLAWIVVTPAPDPNVRNLRGNKAQNAQQAKQKIETIMARLRQGEDFALVAQNLSEDPETAPNGGDLGFMNESALEKVHPMMRGVINSLQPGQMSSVLALPDGSYRVLRLISREPAGQRELNDPRVQQTIRETLINRKDQLLKDAYTEVARNEAEVTNYLARRVVEGASPAPAAAK